MEVIDKSWIKRPRNSLEYAQGVSRFIEFAFAHHSADGTIICPCSACAFKKWLTRDEVYDHSICTQFPIGCTFWFYHGERSIGETSNVSSSSFSDVVQNPLANEQHPMVEVDSIRNLISEGLGVGGNNRQGTPIIVNEVSDGGGERPMPSETPETLEAKGFSELLKDGEEPLYEGCTRYSKLSFLLKLFHIKSLCGMTDKSVKMILELLSNAFEYARTPSSFYKAKKIISKLSLDCTKIHACPNNCILYWGEDENMETCKTAADMRWHATAENKDNTMRHPRDSEAWKRFDLEHSNFAIDPQNVHLALATDGFNPHGTLSANHSIWPVILIPYNTPPWTCMKSTSFIISIIIPGKKIPENNIDVYLQPLIKELKELWVEGCDAYDALTQEVFKLHAALLWTISDFPGLGTLSGWNTYIRLTCPSCNFDNIPHRLNHSKKYCFMGHRRFLDQRHKFKSNTVQFNGRQETRHPPRTLSGSEILLQVENINVTFGRREEIGRSGKRLRTGGPIEGGGTQQWKKKSIFLSCHIGSLICCVTISI
ncbi:uncharacterized protein LOC107633273 [Arachis ipaensis]|uniref:uncharacterized protein LOC107633273 n=1 Tax=Arachis ipaensis TaxID=130454 RepID=UPI0007AFB1FA|nr:uncharacterized protein LOC107633273 [Arachis ipaensis]XP_025639660.1 uncharacterized protein LOC112734524 [Arachis hypogaea]